MSHGNLTIAAVLKMNITRFPLETENHKTVVRIIKFTILHNYSLNALLIILSEAKNEKTFMELIC